MLIAQCPACHARYKVPDEVAGRRARCKKCGQPFQIPDLPPDSGRLSLTALTPPGEGSTVRLKLEKPTRGKAEKGVRLRGEEEESEVAAPAVWGPFLSSVAGSLWAPLRPVNVAPFLIVWILLTISKPDLWAYLIYRPLGVAVWAIVSGWYFSFQFNTVVNATDGKDELPPLTLISGFVDDVVVPLLKMGLARLFVILPAIILVAAMVLRGDGSAAVVTGIDPALSPANIYLTAAQAPAAATPVLALILLAVGLALWPMLVLAGAVSGARGMFRIGLMVQTLVRTAPAYVCVVLIVYATEAVGIVLGAAVGGTQNVPAANGISFSRILVMPALISLADVYLTIIAARTMGLYYYHFKQKFAGKW